MNIAMQASGELPDTELDAVTGAGDYVTVHIPVRISTKQPGTCPKDDPPPPPPPPQNDTARPLGLPSW